MVIQAIPAGEKQIKSLEDFDNDGKSNIIDDYKELNAKLDKVLAKISARKSKK